MGFKASPPLPLISAPLIEDDSRNAETNNIRGNRPVGSRERKVGDSYDAGQRAKTSKYDADTTALLAILLDGLCRQADDECGHPADHCDEAK